MRARVLLAAGTVVIAALTAIPFVRGVAYGPRGQAATPVAPPDSGSGHATETAVFALG